VNYDLQDDVLECLMDRKLVGWGKDEFMYHLFLDDGRVLVFTGMGIVLPSENVQ